MPFFKFDKKPQGTYIRIVESYRPNKNSTPRHKTLLTLGKVEDIDVQKFVALIVRICQIKGVPLPAELQDVSIHHIQETARLQYGIVAIIRHLSKVFQLDKFLSSIQNSSQTQFSIIDILELMIADRMLMPCSKLSTYHRQSEYLQHIPHTQKQTHALQHFYRTLDVLADNEDALKEHLFKVQRNLFSDELEVVFYDVTTLYFESEQEDELRKKGYSKDHRPHKTQIVLGVLVDGLRNPLTYHIYEGNQFEGHTMEKAMEEMKKKYGVSKMIVVADSGMMSKQNIEMLKKLGVEYIIGEPLKRLPEKVVEKIIESKQEEIKALEIKEKREDGGVEEKMLWKEIEEGGKRIIATYSDHRAARDKKKREEEMREAQALVENIAQLKQKMKRGKGLKWIKSEGSEEINYAIDKEKVEKIAKYDGWKGISTNSNMPSEEVIRRYYELFEVEHFFRAMKSEMMIRPIYHWTPKRIRGHVAMCFVSYLFLNYIRIKTGESYGAIKEGIRSMEVSEIKDKKNGGMYYLKGNINDTGKKILKTLGIKEIEKDVIEIKEMEKYIQE
ncbi:MAG: transposase [Vicingaceae bacterium]|nr:MAG: transposase [Vicingaceae bacterium]